ncbi:uncharacterized protein LACBIDRAFT_327878 [Laccaria bicolor S238N-H82]|uniref:Predicted protein n=1 Tax=Laccaria bicolor (strain S238N-H82 / ATCC MYA-4686) TaxID=486041 RepID=B0DD31_LACBS|nr:uncharacterized protein LACBIDRAFT_327878 [Laccaria bicolor S238N-H82]EDR07399.1 predicted protein [Laccaria bicolor S238N-H82]|eukprot:XP_001881791.1 predicted protein [Laccaria bicolor S238N-H82]
MAVPTGTYTIQDVNGNFATSPLILGQPIQFNPPTGAQNQNWLVATINGVSTIRSAALPDFAWVEEPSLAGATVSVNQGAAVDGNQGAIRTVNDPQANNVLAVPLFITIHTNFRTFRGLFSSNLVLQLNSLSPKLSELNKIKLLEQHSKSGLEKTPSLHGVRTVATTESEHVIHFLLPFSLLYHQRAGHLDAVVPRDPLILIPSRQPLRQLHDFPPLVTHPKRSFMATRHDINGPCSCGKCGGQLQVKVTKGGNFPGHYYIHCIPCAYHFIFPKADVPQSVFVSPPHFAQAPQASECPLDPILRAVSLDQASQGAQTPAIPSSSAPALFDVEEKRQYEAAIAASLQHAATDLYPLTIDEDQQQYAVAIAMSLGLCDPPLYQASTSTQPPPLPGSIFTAGAGPSRAIPPMKLHPPTTVPYCLPNIKRHMNED